MFILPFDVRVRAYYLHSTDSMTSCTINCFSVCSFPNEAGLQVHEIRCSKKVEAANAEAEKVREKWRIDLVHEVFYENMKNLASSGSGIGPSGRSKNPGHRRFP